MNMANNLKMLVCDDKNMNNQPQPKAQEFSNFVIFKIDDSKVNIDVKFEDKYGNGTEFQEQNITIGFI